MLTEINAIDIIKSHNIRSNNRINSDQIWNEKGKPIQSCIVRFQHGTNYSKSHNERTLQDETVQNK